MNWSKPTRLMANLLTLTLLSTILGSLVMTSPAAAANTKWLIQSRITTNGKCLEVQGRSDDNSAQIQNYSCSQLPHQLWYMVPVGTSRTRWHIINVNSGLCANVQGNSTQNSAKIIQYECGDASRSNNIWYLEFQEQIPAGDFYYIKSASSGLCMNLQSASVSNGADVMQYRCGVSARNDLWTWAQVS